VGWVLVMASLSDLAAVGAQPIGVSVTLGLPEDIEPTDRTALAQGIGDACRSAATISLGGDTNVAQRLTASACAIGLVRKDRVLTRAGARPGDGLYLSGWAGLGSAYALWRFSPRPSEGGLPGHPGDVPFPFLPRARLRMGQELSGFASSAMDTSDGVVATLDELSWVNEAGFAVTAEPASFLHPRALEACACHHIPPWLALAGCHGEFELVFTVPARLEERFLTTAKERRLCPRRIGQVTAEPGVFLAWGGRVVKIDAGWIRNLRVGGHGDVQRTIDSLVAYARSLPR
jgi:thiamine-monophosphate kinase